MNIHKEPREPSEPADGRPGRDYLVSMIRSLSALARKWRQEEMAIMLDAIVATDQARRRGQP